MKAALHICCAVCAAGAAERLLREGFSIQGYFYNPNLYPEEEYLRRLENAKIVAEKLDFPLTEGPRDFENWDEAVKGLDQEPEGGLRCRVCFKFRLERSFLFMQQAGCDFFTTTLTMGPNKSGLLIRQLGIEVGGASFLERDFKKKAGLQRSGELSSGWGIYRQNYCGCKYSLFERDKRKTQKLQ